MGDEGHYLIVLNLILMYLFVSIIFGFFAGRSIGYPIIWTIAFVFLPGISYLAFFYQLYFIENKRRAFKANQDIIYGTPKPVLGYGKPKEPGAPLSVTPFDEPILSERIEESKEPIFAGWRDRKVEELMAYDQWGKAMELAHEKLSQARESSDTQAIDLYEKYLKTIMSNIMPTYNDDPLELGPAFSDKPSDKSQD